MYKIDWIDDNPELQGVLDFLASSTGVIIWKPKYKVIICNHFKAVDHVKDFGITLNARLTYACQNQMVFLETSVCFNDIR